MVKGYKYGEDQKRDTNQEEGKIPRVNLEEKGNKLVLYAGFAIKKDTFEGTVLKGRKVKIILLKSQMSSMSLRGIKVEKD